MQSGTQTTLNTMVFSNSRPSSQCSVQSDSEYSDSVLSKTSDSVSVVSNLSSATKSSTSTTQSQQLIQPTIDQSIKLVKSYEGNN